MADPALLYCVGATKAGTSWLYAALHDHPECNLRAVKEVHYWDSFDPDEQSKQLASIEANAKRFAEQRLRAEAAAKGWQVRNIDRRLAEIAALAEMLTGDRTGHRAYLNWLRAGVEQPFMVADMTPSYALLPEDTLRQMVSVQAAVKVVYLIRDPLSRLWSHIRMQAQRQKQDAEEFQKKANGILWRILNKGQETHLTARGDYIETVSKLRRVVPEGKLHIEFAERLYTPEGWERLCTFLGIAATEPESGRKVHEGGAARMREDLAPLAVRFLKDQYEWVAANVAPLPREWQDNLARASA